MEQKTKYLNLVPNFVFLEKLFFWSKSVEQIPIPGKVVLDRIATARRFSAKITLKSMLQQDGNCANSTNLKDYLSN